jgi:hypothetical protein
MIEEWKVGNGEWGMGNGKWGMESGEWGMGKVGSGVVGFENDSRSMRE